MDQKDKEFTLDRDGGRDKITRAMYGPKAFRRGKDEGMRGSGKAFWIMFAIGVAVGVASFARYFLRG